MQQTNKKQTATAIKQSITLTLFIIHELFIFLQWLLIFFLFYWKSWSNDDGERLVGQCCNSSYLVGSL